MSRWLRGAPDRPDWVVVIALKRLDQAKTRLQLDPGGRSELALAMALDTAVAVRQSPRVAAVFVVCPDPRVRDPFCREDVQVIGTEPGDGMNSALSHGGATAGKLFPGFGLAMMTGDVPALRPAEITVALTYISNSGAVSFVADAEGTGTVLLAASAGSTVRPRFGASSARAHTGAGALEVSDPRLVGLRRDVDSVEDLDTAVELGLGPYSTRALRRLSRLAS